MRDRNVYSAIIERIFHSKYSRGKREVPFEREDLINSARALGIEIPKNLGDLICSFRYRANLPESISETAGQGRTWVIKPAGRGKYCFVLVPDRPLVPNPNFSITKVPDSTPGVVSKYAMSDEQALLAKLRYSRLVDIFSGVTCYSLQNHLRTTVPGIGQVETDELYVGVDRKGVHYVFPVQAKGGMDRLSPIQVEQDVAVCTHKFSALVCRPIGAQFLDDDIIALFEFELDADGVTIAFERHYRLVSPDEVTEKDLENYRSRVSD